MTSPFADVDEVTLRLAKGQSLATPMIANVIPRASASAGSIRP